MNFTKLFLKKEQKLTKNNIKLQKAIDKTIELLSEFPKNPILQSHKILRKTGATAFSSKINSDLRIIWKYHQNSPFILDIVDIGGHSGNDKVCK